MCTLLSSVGSEKNQCFENHYSKEMFVCSEKSPCVQNQTLLNFVLNIVLPSATLPDYTLTIQGQFHSSPFSPLCSFEDQPDTLFIDQVKRDSVYELVITNAGGLYRFRFGDVVKVVDFYNQCPVIELMYR